MNNLIYDELLCFGSIAPIASGKFPNVLNMGRKAGSKDSYPGEQFTTAERRTVDVFFDLQLNQPNANDDALVSIVVQGSTTADGATWTVVGGSVFSFDQMKHGPCQTAISPNEFQYLRVEITLPPSVQFSGSAKCYLNTYAGK